MPVKMNVHHADKLRRNFSGNQTKSLVVVSNTIVTLIHQSKEICFEKTHNPQCAGQNEGKETALKEIYFCEKIGNVTKLTSFQSLGKASEVITCDWLSLQMEGP